MAFRIEIPPVEDADRARRPRPRVERSGAPAEPAHRKPGAGTRSAQAVAESMTDGG